MVLHTLENSLLLEISSHSFQLKNGFVYLPICYIFILELRCPQNHWKTAFRSDLAVLCWKETQTINWPILKVAQIPSVHNFPYTGFEPEKVSASCIHNGLGMGWQAFSGRGNYTLWSKAARSLRQTWWYELCGVNVRILSKNQRFGKQCWLKIRAVHALGQWRAGWPLAVRELPWEEIYTPPISWTFPGFKHHGTGICTWSFIFHFPVGSLEI